MTADRIAPSRRALFDIYRGRRATEWVSATGTSMLPTVRPGSWLLIEFGARAKVGEIAVFQQGELIVGHRVVRRRNSGSGAILVTKGDGMRSFDRPLAAGDVLGVVRAVRHEPGGEELREGGARGRAIALVSLLHGFAVAAGSRAKRALRAGS
jgi:Peptidase S24-like